jgi:hypothetical protein
MLLKAREWRHATVLISQAHKLAKRVEVEGADFGVVE